MLQLQVIYGKDAGKCLNFRQSVVHIGTDSGNDFQLTDNSVSGMHGQFTCNHDGHYAYCDLQSERGSRVRSASIDVLLYSHQLAQSVPLTGEVLLSIGQSVVRCNMAQDEVSDNHNMVCAGSISLVTMGAARDVNVMAFLLEMSTALTSKTSQQAVLSYLSQAILQRIVFSVRVTLWRFDSCAGTFSCLYERSRGELPSVPSVDHAFFQEAIHRRMASLYRSSDPSMSTIVTPLVTSTRELGVIEIDSLHDDGLSQGDLDTIARLSEVASYAVERTFFNADVSTLFDGFIRSIIAVMDARAPASSGHSRRVAKYALVTAQAIHASQLPPFQSIQFSHNHLDELRFAALLHDIGKVVLRREILLKASKLTPSDLQHLLDRIELFAAWFGTQSPEKLGSRYRSPQSFALYCEVVTRVQQVNVVATEKDRRLIDEMYETTIDPCPNLRLLTASERESLLIDHGTLTPDERHEVERHALISWQYLSQIAWPPRWADVPIFVLQHHEKLNGTGYPHGIRGDQIRIQSRILTVCDIFDALTGGDRPYKTRHSFGDAAAILKREAQSGALDPNIVRIFITQVIPQLSSPDDSSSGSSLILGG